MSEAFERKEREPKAEKLRFEGVEGKDVYNVTAPFESDGKTYIVGRVESPETIADAHSVFFTRKDGVWEADKTLPNFKLEDPFVTKMDGELIFGGVETYPLKDAPSPEWKGYRTIFYKGKDIKNLEQFCKGPDMMKDIRLVELGDSGVGVFTRPRGEIGGKGTIGFIRLDSLDELTPEKILQARLLEGQFGKNEWGGVNNARLLKDGTIGVIGHIGNEDADGKHYRVISFTFNPDTFRASAMKVIATRKDFPEGKVKDSKLKDIVFPSGYADETLYVGLSDAEAARLHLPDPFEKGSF